MLDDIIEDAAVHSIGLRIDRRQNPDTGDVSSALGLQSLVERPDAS